MDRRFLDALEGKNQGRAPVWLMRQAGRYLPEYRALREKHSLHDLFFTPELAAKVTLMPIQRFGFDAAILFSDITVVAKAMGLALTFDEGPKVSPVVTRQNYASLPSTLEALEPIFQTIELLKQELEVPLIGFCGGPFTVASYLAGGMEETKKWMREAPESFSLFLERIASVSEIYLREQVDCGVDAVQLFDSWASELTEEEFQKYSLPFVKRLAKSVEVPLIFFMRDVARHVDLLKGLEIALSFDEGTSFSEMRKRTAQTLQGNFDADDLFLPKEAVREKVEKLLEEVGEDPAFILNLGHGVKPKTPIENIEILVGVVRQRAVSYTA